jgi:hypothetical protein
VIYTGHPVITVRVGESRLLQWIGHVACMRTRNAHINFIGELPGKLTDGIHRKI